MNPILHRHLTMLSEWWGWDEDHAGAKLLTHAPLSGRTVVHAIMAPDGTFALYPSAAAARQAWEALCQTSD